MEQNRKTTLLLLLGFFVLVGIPLLIWILQPRQQRTPTPTPTITRLPTVFIPITPAGNGKVLINNIPVNDFTKNAKTIDTAGDVYFIEKPEYQIGYMSPFNLFQITIQQTPFEENRQKAEAEFLSSLGITQQQACQMNVQIGMPGFVDPEYAGRIFKLSFCE